MGKGGGEVMGNSIASAFYFIHQPVYLVKHVVDELREHVEFISPACWQALIQIALGNAQRHAMDIAHAPHLPHAQEQPRRDTGQQEQDPAADKRVERRFANPFYVAEISSNHELRYLLPMLRCN